MFSRIAAVLAAVFVLYSGQAAVAQERPIPEAEWTPEARYNLARCLVGEAGWSAPDHAAIPWALTRSWNARLRGGHELTFATQVERYCAVLHLEHPTPRQVWVLALPETGPMTEANEPEAFPDHLTWAGYSERWDAVRAFVDRWARGEVEDPCPRADHWGGTTDSIGSAAVRVCVRASGGMHNTFFYINPEVRRALVRDRARRLREAEREIAEMSASIPAGLAAGSLARRRDEDSAVGETLP